MFCRSCKGDMFCRLRIYMPQWSLIVWEVAGVQNLNAGIVLTIEGSDGGRTPGRPSRFRRAKPKTEVIHLYRVEGGIQACIGKWSIEDNRRWRGAGRNGKRLNTET